MDLRSGMLDHAEHLRVEFSPGVFNERVHLLPGDPELLGEVVLHAVNGCHGDDLFRVVNPDCG